MNPPLSATHKDTPVRVYHIENGTAYVVLPDGTATCADWKALRFPKDPAFVAQAPVAQAPATPALAPAVRWADWVDVNDSTIRRSGSAEDGGQHLQSIYHTDNEAWVWIWFCNGSVLHEQEGYSERKWARRDCEAYTAKVTP